MSVVLTRKFGEEMVQFLGKKVAVETSDQKIYNGTLTGIDEKLDVVLDNLQSLGILKIILNGSFVKEIKLMEKPFDFKALSDTNFAHVCFPTPGFPVITNLIINSCT